MIPFETTLVSSLIALTLCFSTNCSAGGYQIRQTEKTIQAFQNDELIWQYNHDVEEGKPYFHPLASTSSHVFSDLRPEDHPWHRGLWFSCKFIDGVNYWEEDRETGESEGKTRILNINKNVTRDSVVQINLKLSYCAGSNNEPVMIEDRNVQVFPPDKRGKYRIIWKSCFEAVTMSVELNRTPVLGEPMGKVWGGYAGWSLRMNKQSLGGLFQNSSGETGDVAKNKTASWMKYELLSGETVLLMDHPDNFNYPSVWYVATNMPFFSPAVIYDGPFLLMRGQSLTLKYQVVIAPEEIDTADATHEWDSWID